MSALSATDKRFELQQKLKARQAGPEDPTMSSAEQKELLEKRLLEITNEETRMNEKDKTWDSDAKVSLLSATFSVSISQMCHPPFPKRNPNPPISIFCRCSYFPSNP